MDEETNELPVEVSASTDSNPDTEGLKKALESERARARKLEKDFKAIARQLKAFEGLDPEKAREAELLTRQANEREAELEARAIEAEKEAQRRFDPLLQSARQEAETARKETETAKAELLNLKRDYQLKAAYESGGGLPGEFVAVQGALASRVGWNKAGELVPLTKDGKPAYVAAPDGTTRLQTLSELVTELKNDPEMIWFSRHFQGSEIPGFGAIGNGTSGYYSEDLSQLSPWEAVNRTRQNKR